MSLSQTLCGTETSGTNAACEQQRRVVCVCESGWLAAWNSLDREKLHLWVYLPVWVFISSCKALVQTQKHINLIMFNGILLASNGLRQTTFQTISMSDKSPVAEWNHGSSAGVAACCCHLHHLEYSDCLSCTFSWCIAVLWQWKVITSQ